jgi:hypothetical protein
MTERLLVRITRSPSREKAHQLVDDLITATHREGWSAETCGNCQDLMIELARAIRAARDEISKQSKVLAAK